MIKINGVSVEFSPITLAEYLSSTPYDSARIAVEINGRIIPKSQYTTTLLQNEDVVEIVSFVGGG